MGFFARGGNGDAEDAEAMARIGAGGIPRRAEERLRALAADGSLFTSGLSVNEFALLERMGPAPLAQVMGASVIRIGWQYLPPLEPGTAFIPSGAAAIYGPMVSARAIRNRYTEASVPQIRNYRWRAEVVCELDTLTDAWNLARRRALDRLAEEAIQVGADAVVGVHLRRSDHDLGRRTIEYVVSGTAIRLPNCAPRAWPTITDVSVHDYWRLHTAGHEPVGFVATTAVVFASPPQATQMARLRTAARNQELSELSRGFHAARETVRAKLLGQVSDAKGTGAVGVQFSHSVHREKLPVASSLGSRDRRGWHQGRLGVPYRVSGRGDAERSGWVITMHAAGTAIAPARSSSPPAVKPTLRIGVR